MPKPQYGKGLSRSEQAAIHALRRQACMDDGEYRELLFGVTGKRTTKDMPHTELRRVLDRFAALGYKSTSRLRRERAAPDRHALLAKLDAQLAAKGRDRVYLAGMVRRICKVDTLEFCTPAMLTKLIAALNYDAGRHA
ncbi:regulatory protein GemA [Burkholderia ambifaria]|uniref:regulatory protein GemA n=1 Tax=Burkholderia ambifaria TaxID=152480 RepID=UPI00158A222D|nr:regulatory protein GemA [Burkholderia ambifaria]